MREIPESLFAIYALALPRGHGFSNSPPVGAWQSENGFTLCIIKKDFENSVFEILVRRRQVDHVWVTTSFMKNIATFDEALHQITALLRECEPPEPLPENRANRPAMYDLAGRKPSPIFSLLTKPSHHAAAWILNQLYLSLPNPDKNWVSDCQTENFHTRLWEAQLLASFREQGLLVSQTHNSPDFHIQNQKGGSAWIEAVTANPQVRYNHVGSTPSHAPENMKTRFLGPAAERFAKTLGNKLDKKYHNLEHVKDKPFGIALADFHAPSSMTWSREALISYLYGFYLEVKEDKGVLCKSVHSATHLLGKSKFPAGLFCDKKHSELSAVIFTNACSIAKLNRVGVSAGMDVKGLKYIRVGKFYDRTPGALKGIPFCLDVTSPEYRSLWPQGYEPWCAELEVFHNPYAKYPISKKLLPEASHWFKQDGDIICKAFYETSILYSKTHIQSNDPQ